MAETSTARPSIGQTLTPSNNNDYTIAVNQQSTVVKRVASGQITITDLNDGQAIQAYTTASLGMSQVYKPDTKTYTPDYTYVDNSSVAHPNVITAKVFVTGYGTDQAPTARCTEWAWKVNGSTTLPTGYTVSTSAPHQLRIAANLPTGGSVTTVEWECKFTDPDSGAKTTVQHSATLSLVESAGATGMVIITVPNGDTFDDANGVTSLTAEARLYRGSTVDTTVKSAVWEKLDIADGTWKAVPASSVAALSNGMSKLTVTASDVLNFQTYRCTITDTETSEAFSNVKTFMDATDPYTIELYAPSGTAIKNGEGETVVYARLYRNGQIVEDGESKKFDYSWSKFNKNGTATAWTDTTGTINNGVRKFGNPVTVKAADVNVKCNLFCIAIHKS